MADPSTWEGWGIFGIVMAVILGLGVLGGSLWAFSKTDLRASVFSIIGGFLFAMVNFLPFGLLTFGFVADVIGQEFRYSYASLFGMLSIIINWLVGFTIGGSQLMSTPGAEQPGTTWCMIPGLEGLENKYMPMSIVSSWTILTYYVIFAATQRALYQNASIYASTGGLLLIQAMSFYGSDCSTFYMGDSRWRFFSVLLGIIVGSVGYGIISTLNPGQAPFVPVSGAFEHFLSGSGWNIKKTYTSSPSSPQIPEVRQCSADESGGDEYVAEIYKNGVLVTEDISK